MIKIEKLGATHIDIDPWIDDGSSWVDISAICVRLETDSELNSRIQKIDRLRAQMTVAELKEYERLRLKFGL